MNTYCVDSIIWFTSSEFCNISQFFLLSCNLGWGVGFSRGRGLPPLHGRARLTKAIKRTLLSILEQAAAAHYLVSQLISKAVRNAQQYSKWNSLIWYFPVMLPYSVVMTGGRWNICPVMEKHLIPLSLSCLIWEQPLHLGHLQLRRNQRFTPWCVCMCFAVFALVCFLSNHKASPRPLATGLNYQPGKTLTYFASLQELPEASSAWYYCPSAALSKVVPAWEK